MFKFAKYYFILNWFKKAKRNMLAIVVLVVLLFVSSYMFNDLIAMANEKFELVVAKWIVIVLFLGVITFNLIQMFKAIPSFFRREVKSKIIDEKKERIVTKEYLLSRSDLIIGKYKDSK